MFAVFHRTRKAAIGLLASLGALALTACDLPVANNLSGGPSINPGAPVVVALLVPKSSAERGISAIGQSLENSARMAVTDLDGTQIDLRVYDTAGDPALAASAGSRAVADGAKIIIGPLFQESTAAVAAATAGSGVNILSFSNNASLAYAESNVFILGATFKNTADRLVSYAARNDKRNMVVVHGTDVPGQLGYQAVQSALSGSPAREVGTVVYEPSQEAVVASVGRIRDEVGTSGANAIFFTSNTQGALPLYAQMLPEAGLISPSPQFIGLTRWDIPPQTLGYKGVEGAWFALPDPTKSSAFRARYKSTYGAEPHPIGGLGYDGIAAVGALVASGNSNALTGRSLTQSRGFQGTGGIFRLLPDGTNERGLAVATVRDKQVVVIDPAPTSFSAFGS
ncbi:penicillin-binding protein activator [Chachezhania antarctica]|uniref:penicillin-binding protein activator n=1 Tax=Chachezhania antarctica TaxID=2340860 RepID=UPI000EAE5099|nr:penicillin-binding protein activator [Chachezhania antarctica]|tara:strand:+ start:3010 stop:4197 length:1188 start_codon:yes stop_codon:yes gene_type:complete